MNEKNTIDIKWSEDDVEFSKREQQLIDAISVEKDILRKINNKQTNKLVVQMLNWDTTKDYVEWYKKAMTVFLSVFK